MSRLAFKLLFENNLFTTCALCYRYDNNCNNVGVRPTSLLGLLYLVLSFATGLTVITWSSAFPFGVHLSPGHPPLPLPTVIRLTDRQATCCKKPFRPRVQSVRPRVWTWYAHIPHKYIHTKMLITHYCIVELSDFRFSTKTHECLVWISYLKIKPLDVHREHQVFFNFPMRNRWLRFSYSKKRYVCNMYSREKRLHFKCTIQHAKKSDLAFPSVVLATNHFFYRQYPESFEIILEQQW